MGWLSNIFKSKKTASDDLKSRHVGLDEFIGLLENKINDRKKITKK